VITEAPRRGETVPGLMKPDGPGLLIVDDDLRVLTMTPHTERWLDDLPDGRPELPDAVRSVAGRARRDSGGPVGHHPRSHVRGSSGRWLAIYASRIRETGEIAVIIEEARSVDVAPHIMRDHGLSPREVQVTSLVLRGLSTRQIAAEMYLSPYTVQDYLKAVFTKLGVRSRRELVAWIYERRQ
jgi:DNA-binding CsgD family transcriptional regulator